MWKIGYIVHSLFWAIPGILFPLTFRGSDSINYLFMDVIESFCIALPFTFYWALSFGFFVAASVQKPSVKEPISKVDLTA